MLLCDVQYNTVHNTNQGLSQGLEQINTEPILITVQRSMFTQTYAVFNRCLFCLIILSLDFQLFLLMGIDYGD